MLSHQIIFSQSLTPLYQPNMGVAEAEDGVNKRRPTYLTATATKVAEDYETAMNYCREELSPEFVNYPFAFDSRRVSGKGVTDGIYASRNS
jgi:hypothetical protein